MTNRTYRDPSAEGLKARRRSGWGIGLYRDTCRGKIAGVAAGLAQYWDVAPWVVRLLWVGAFIFSGSLALWAYVGAWVLLIPRSAAKEQGGDAAASEGGPMEYDERRHEYRPRKTFRYPESASVRVRRAQERLDTARARIEAMESYVTSRQYALDKELSQL